MKKILLLLTAALCLGTPAAFAGSSPVRVTGNATAVSNPDVTSLIRRARILLNTQAQYKNAVLLEADGATASGKPTTKANGVDEWRLVFNNQGTDGSKFKSAYLFFKNGKFSKITGVTEPFLEDLNLNPLPVMTLGRAVQLLHAAGFKQAFRFVTLRFPVDPGYKAPVYFFEFAQGGLFVQVDTKTGKVKKLSS